MDLAPTPRAMPLSQAQPSLPLHRAAPAPAADQAGQRFEALLIARLLPMPQPATQGALAAGQELVAEQATRLRAEALARTSPFGIAAVIARAPQ